MPKDLNLGGQDFGDGKKEKKAETYHAGRKLTEEEYIKHTKKLKAWKFDMKAIVDKAKTSSKPDTKREKRPILLSH